jgi:hypothetical protein
MARTDLPKADLEFAASWFSRTGFTVEQINTRSLMPPARRTRGPTDQPGLNDLAGRSGFAGFAGFFVELAFFGAGRDVDLVLRVDRTLEVLDGLTQAIAKLWQLRRAEHDDHNDENEYEFAEAHSEGHECAP